MAAYTYRLATAQDNDKIQDLYNNTPQRGLVTLGFEFAPNFFDAIDVSCTETEVYVAENNETGVIDGIACLGIRELYVNGKVEIVSYANNLRIRPECQGRSILSKLFSTVKDALESQDRWAHMVILEENQRSIKALTTKRKSLPTFYPYGRLYTYLVSTYYDLAGKPEFDVRQAESKDIPAMQDFLDRESPKRQFYPKYDLTTLDTSPYFRELDISNYFLAIDAGEIVGICGIWKQKKFKQTRVVDYPKWMVFVRPLYNLWCSIFGGFSLPSKGKTADYSSVHSICIKDNNPRVLQSLLKTVRKTLAKNKDSSMIVALPEGDPLLPGLDGFLKQRMVSLHYLATYGKDITETLDKDLPFYLEVSRL